jgi:hypothetical protein
MPATANRLGRGERRAEIYEVVGSPCTFRIRAERYPGHAEPASGWFGGRVLWGHDQDSRAKALEIAREWIDNGTLPESTCK